MENMRDDDDYRYADDRDEKEIQNYVFGYGSLMCRHSRAATIGKGDSVVTTPVILQGWQVHWSTRTPYRMTALGIVRVVPDPADTGRSSTSNTDSDDERKSSFNTKPDCDSNGTTTTLHHQRLVRALTSSSSSAAAAVGVLIPVTVDELMQFDEREGDEYQRTRVSMRDVHLFGAPKTTESVVQTSHPTAVNIIGVVPHAEETIAVWVYRQIIPEHPSPLYPISQSYLDVILRGCLDISLDFAAAFLQLVQGWHCDKKDDGTGTATTTCASTITEETSSHTTGRRRPSAYVNDRTTPIYIRGDIEWSRDQAKVLDELIRTHQPVAFQHRQCL